MNNFELYGNSARIIEGERWGCGYRETWEIGSQREIGIFSLCKWRDVDYYTCGPIDRVDAKVTAPFALKVEGRQRFSSFADEDLD